MRDLERFMVLQVVDVRWREHLENMDYLREGIHLRGMAQKDPLVEYRNEGHVLFSELNRTIREEVVALLFHAQIEANEETGNGNGTLPSQQNGSGGGGRLSYQHETTAGAGALMAAGAGAGASAMATSGGEYVAPQPVVKSEQESVGRNDPCWCGSGKKYKRCHGQ